MKDPSESLVNTVLQLRLINTPYALWAPDSLVEKDFLKIIKGDSHYDYVKANIPFIGDFCHMCKEKNTTVTYYYQYYKTEGKIMQLAYRMGYGGPRPKIHICNDCIKD